LILATKACGPGEWVNYFRGGPRHTKAHLDEAIDASLARLQTDYVDLYQLHWPDRRTNFFGQLGYTHDQDAEETPIDDILTALESLVVSGKVRAIGLSNETPWGVMTFLEIARREGLPVVASIQNPYSLLNRTFEIGLAEIAHRESVGLLAYSPLAFGVLSGKYLEGARPAGARLTLFDRFSRYSNPGGDTRNRSLCATREGARLDADGNGARLRDLSAVPDLQYHRRDFLRAAQREY
jgi:aryl-alcohol dehydrogenase-like predicted oxidoreductase